MEIKEMNLAEVEARAAEIREMAEITEEVKAEAQQLAERKAELKEFEERKAAVAELEAGAAANVIDQVKPESEERTMFAIDSKEYRDAFFANLLGKATPEQRGMFADNTAYGDGIALPVQTDVAIWDQVATAHPILADINKQVTGTALKVTKSTPAAVTGKKDSAALTEQTFTNVEVTLAGIDYSTYVTLSFSEAKMSVGAAEAYLVKEIASAIGESLAKAVFARILSDVGSAAATKSTSNTYFTCLASALAAATQADNAVVYAPASLYYAMMSEVDTNGQPIIRDGVSFGRPIKIDNAATKITVVDPAQFILNVVNDVTIDSDKDLTKAAYIIGGYCRAEGCLRKVKAAAYIG